jgi:hypothetical protein
MTHFSWAIVGMIMMHSQAYLNKLQLFGQEISVSISKHNDIQMPTSITTTGSHIGGGISSGDELTRDYTNSPIHRFRNRVTRGTKNINPPSQVPILSHVISECGHYLTTHFSFLTRCYIYPILPKVPHRNHYVNYLLTPSMPLCHLY